MSEMQPSGWGWRDAALVLLLSVDEDGFRSCVGEKLPDNAFSFNR